MFWYKVFIDGFILGLFLYGALGGLVYIIHKAMKIWSALSLR